MEADRFQWEAEGAICWGQESGRLNRKQCCKVQCSLVGMLGVGFLTRLRCIRRDLRNWLHSTSRSVWKCGASGNENGSHKWVLMIVSMYSLWMINVSPLLSFENIEFVFCDNRPTCFSV